MTHLRTRRRVALPALAGAVALTAVALAAPSAQAATTKLTIVQHNVAKKPSALSQALKKAHSLGAQAITLQEVCAKDVPSIQAYAASIGQTWTVHPQQSRTNACGAGNDVMTVAVRTAKGATEVVRPLSADERGSNHTRQQELVCVRWGKKPVRTVCSVHVALGNATVVGNPGLNARKTQIKEIKDHTAKFIGNGQLVVVGGDFNAKPKDPVLNRMYARGKDKAGKNPNGKFSEATQLQKKSAARGGKFTATTKEGKKRKIDYVFFSNNKTPWSQTGASLTTAKSRSDHEIVVAQARVQK